MQHHRGVLTRLDHFVQVTDTAFAHRAGQGTVLPPGALRANQVATDQVGGRQVVMTGDGIQRQAQTVRHVLHEASLAAAGRAFDQHRHAVLPGLLEQRLFVTQGLVEGRGMHGCGFDWIHGRIHYEYLTGGD
ncbi:hypothetical protein D3C72_1427280 [compost metagenome]